MGKREIWGTVSVNTVLAPPNPPFKISEHYQQRQRADQRVNVHTDLHLQCSSQCDQQ